MNLTSFAAVPSAYTVESVKLLAPLLDLVPEAKREPRTQTAPGGQGPSDPPPAPASGNSQEPRKKRWAAIKNFFADWWAKLDVQSRYVLDCRYGLGQKCDLIGQNLGIKPYEVVRIETLALDRLQQMMRNDPISIFFKMLASA